jgi:hypothetical protein
LKNLRVLFLLGLLFAWQAATAKTPDGKPPSQETVCDGLSGAAFGLCNAYCEAMDCDNPGHHASDTACAQVKNNYERRTGQPLPCEVTCPCGSLLPLFADLVNGDADIASCVDDGEILSVLTPENAFAVVNGAGMPPFCSVGLVPPFVQLTPLEVVACRDALHRASAAQGIECAFPE